MINNNMGYACINMKLSSQKPKIYTGRSMIKRTFKSKGIQYASELGMGLSSFVLHLIYSPGVVNISYLICLTTKRYVVFYLM